jgi:uncharacterized protein involved in tolerance to divalent cations
MMDYELHAEAILIMQRQRAAKARLLNEVVAVSHHYDIPVVIETSVPRGAPWYAPNHYDPSKDHVEHYNRPIR